MTLQVYPPVNSPEWWFAVANGDITGVSVVHKFGRHLAVGTGFVPVSVGGAFRTPQVASATTLRVKAGDAIDTAAGDGAREVTLQGLDETGTEVTEALATAGTSASSATTATFIRLYRAWVSASGTYASATAGSHQADIVIENGAGGTDWLTIDSTDFPRGQSECGVYSVPLGKTAYIANIHISVDSGKTADVVLFHRGGILETSAPYPAMRVKYQAGGVKGLAMLHTGALMGPYPALSDIGFMAKAAATSEVDVDFELILIDD